MEDNFSNSAPLPPAPAPPNSDYPTDEEARYVSDEHYKIPKSNAEIVWNFNKVREDSCGIYNKPWVCKVPKSKYWNCVKSRSVKKREELEGSI